MKGFFSNPYVKAILVTVFALFVIQRIEPVRKFIYGA